MRLGKLLLIFCLVNQLICLPAFSRPGETVDMVLKKFDVEGEKPVAQEDYVSYKVNDSKFVSKPTLFLKLGAKGIVLEENFLFDKNTVHERDVQKAKNDARPTAAIPHQAYLVGDFSQLPRESFDTKSKIIGGFAAPFGSVVGSLAGAGKGLYEGTKIGFKTADSASRALGGDVSGKTSAWAASATAITTGAITGLVGGLTGGVVEGSVRGARVAIEGISGADMKITEAIPVDSQYVIIGGRIGKELTPEEQKDLLNKLSQLEQSRLASEGLNIPQKTATDIPLEIPSQESDTSKAFDSAADKSGFEQGSSYLPEDSTNKNVAGMW